MNDHELILDLNEKIITISAMKSRPNIIVVDYDKFLKIEIKMLEYERDMATDKKQKRFLKYTLMYMRKKLKLLNKNA